MMDRRQFAGVVLTSPVAAFGQSRQSTTNMPALQTQLDLQSLRAKYRKDLFDDYLPFHLKYVVDPKYGGFLCTVTPKGELVGEGKRTWFEGRGTWVFSFLYNNIAKEQQYLDVAARSVKLFMALKPSDPDAFWPGAITRDGKAGGPPDTQLYGDLFLAEGLAEFSKATGDRNYWDEAREIILKCVRRYDRPGYCPEIGATYLGPNARPFPGARILGVWMVLIRSITQMLAIRADSELQKIADRCVDAILNHHLNSRFNLLNELINHDLSRPTNEYEQLVYAGHAIETLWMVLHEAIRRADWTLFNRTRQIFQRHCDVAKDRVYGGLFRNLTNVDQNAWTLDKTLFPHQEALIGTMCLIEQIGDPWGTAFYIELDKYTREKFPMRRIGSPLWQVQGNRQVDITPDMKRAENYHHPRYLMLNLLAVEKLISRKGTPARG